MSDIPHWSICLQDCPRLLNAAVTVHGHETTEKWTGLNFWCLHLYRYEADIGINGQWFRISPGWVSVIPPKTRLEYRFRGRSPHAYAHFTLARPRAAPRARVFGLRDLGSGFERINSEIEQAIGWFSINPRRAEVRLWDLLWEFAQASEPAAGLPGGDASRHPAVARVMQFIELRLAEPLAVPELAREVDLSHNHLTRLFRATVGSTVVGYIRQRRVQHARHLLLHSNLPIKAVAAQVGIRDLHLFNKTIRQVLGRSPRGVRKGPLR